MKLEDAVSYIERTLNEYKQKISESFPSVTVITRIGYEDDEFDECEADSEKLKYLYGELFMTCGDITEDEAPGRCITVEYKNGVSDTELADELKSLCEDIDSIYAELKKCDDVENYLKKIAAEADKEAEELFKKFESDMKTLDRTAKILTVAGILIIAFAVIIAIIGKSL